MKKAAAARAPPRPIQIRAQTRATEAATASSTGSSTRRNWGTPKSNSAWKVDSPISRPPIRPTRRRRTIRAGSVGGGSVADRRSVARPHPLDQQHGLADQGHAGAPDQHQVGRAPEGHVLAEQPVPEVVEREADEGEGAAGGDQEPADGRVPVARDADGGRAGALLRQADREVAGAEDAEQAGEDQVVGGVGERARVATGVDVERDVPVHPEQRDQKRCGGQRRGEGRPAGEAGDSLGEVGGAAEVGDPAAAMAHPEPGDRGAQHQGGAGGDRHLVEGGAAGGLAGGEEALRPRVEVIAFMASCSR